MKQLRLIIASLFLIAPFTANADPVTWSLSDLSLTDGTLVEGEFTYDAMLDIVSDIDITLSNGVVYDLTNQFFQQGAIGFFFTETAAADYTGQATLWVRLTTDLTDAGGTVPINTEFGWGWGFCSIANCFSASNPGDLRGDLTGSLAAVPEPGTLALLGLGLAGMGMARRKKKV